MKECALSVLTGVLSAGLPQRLKEQSAGSPFHPVLPRDFRIQAQIISLYPSTEYQRSRIILGRFSLALEKNWRL